METTGLEPANADNNAPVNTGEVDSDPVDTGGADPAPAAADTGNPPRDRVQERIDALTSEKYEARSERDRERYRREALEQRLAAIESAKTEPVAPVTNFPTLEQFGWDEAKYQAAVDAHWTAIADAKVAAKFSEREQAAAATAKQQSWAKREAEFIKSNPGYVEKVKHAALLPISEEIQAELQGSDLGPQVALYLVENREKAIAIMQMPLSSQLREIGRIEARLEEAKASQKPAVSQAPAPISKIEGDQSSGSVRTTDSSGDSLSDDEWFKAEKKRLSRKKVI
jgi:hypothetical protein